MKERPIIFSAPMVRAILDGRKTQTRRVIKSPARNMQKQGHEVIKRNPDNDPWYKDYIWSMRVDGGSWADYKHERFLQLCPYGAIGDKLWVRETFGSSIRNLGGTPHEKLVYKADNPNEAYCYSSEGAEIPIKWKSPIFMPRWASRITLEITNLRVERVQDISCDDANAEGVQAWVESFANREIYHENGNLKGYPVTAYKRLWEQINGAGSWDANPWVWIIGVKRI